MDYCPTDLCPDVEVCECVGLGVCEFLDELPAVIDEGCGVARRPLRYAAGLVVVGVGIRVGQDGCRRDFRTGVVAEGVRDRRGARRIQALDAA